MTIALGVLSFLLALSLVVNAALWHMLRRVVGWWFDAEEELERRRNGPPVDLLVAEAGETVTRVWLN